MGIEWETDVVCQEEFKQREYFELYEMDSRMSLK